MEEDSKISEIPKIESTEEVTKEDPSKKFDEQVSDTLQTVTTKLKYAQIELAWYVYIYEDSHTKHEALIAQGVKSFDLSKFSEDSSGRTGLPKVVEDLLDDYNIGSGGYLPLIEREVSENE